MKYFKMLTVTMGLILIMFCATSALADENAGVRTGSSRLAQTYDMNFSLDYLSHVTVSWEIPENTSRLQIFVSDSSGNVDLFVKYGSAVSGSSIEELEADADFVSDGPSWGESVTIDDSTTPPLQQGRYYATVLNYNNDKTTGAVNFFAALSDDSKKLYYPHLDTRNAWVMEFGVNNLGDSAVSGTMSLYDDSGEFIADMEVNVAAYGSQKIDVGTDFGVATAGYGIFTHPSGSIAGYTAYSKPGMFKAAVPAVPDTDIAVEKLFAAHVHSDGKWWTGFAFVNTRSVDTTLNVDFDDGSSAEIPLPAFGHLATGVQEMFGGNTLPNAQVATITPAEGVIGFELFTWGNQLAGILLREDGGDSLQFPYLARDDANEWVGLAINNPNDTAVQLTINTYNTLGESQGDITLFPAAGQKVVGMPDTLNISSEADWVNVSAEEPVHGFFLIGDTAGSYLAGTGNVDRLSMMGTFMDVNLTGTTQFYLANPSDAEATVYFYAWDSDGLELDNVQVNIPAHGSLVTTPQDLFTNLSANASSISYTSFISLAAFERVISPEGMEAHMLPAALPSE